MKCQTKLSMPSVPLICISYMQIELLYNRNTLNVYSQTLILSWYSSII